MSTVCPEEAIIVGASFTGLCTAWQLRKRGVERICVLEQHRIGHRKGASHGRTRVLSTAGYDDPVQTLLALSRDQAWPELQEDLGRTVCKRTSGLVLGPLNDAFRKAAESHFGRPGELSAVPLAKARAAWPVLELPAGTGTAADEGILLIAAETAMDALLAWLQQEGVKIVPNTTVTSIHSTADGLWLETDRGRRVAERVISTAGRGTPHLFERSLSRIQARTVVSAFFSVDLPESDWRPGRFPAIRALGDEGQPLFTVSPEFADRGIKVERHTRDDGMDTDPGLDAVRAWFEATVGPKVTAQLGREVRRVVHIEDRPMIVDTHHDDPRIVFAAGANGQEVALGPILGKAMAELALDGRSAMAEFQRNRKYFALPRRSLPKRRKRPSKPSF